MNILLITRKWRSGWIEVEEGGESTIGQEERDE